MIRQGNMQLSDSSTSESEDDAHKMHPKGFDDFSAPVQIAPKYSSTSESEDDYGRKRHQPARSLQIGNSLKHKSEDTDCLYQNRKTGKFDSKEFKMPSNTKYPTLASECSGSESDDRSSAERTISTERNTPNKKSTQKSDAKSVYGQASMNMMKKMGYKEGTGLGKHGQGRTEIVEASKQRGRRGLGLQIKGLEPADIKWDFDKEQESVTEGVTWMPKCNEEPPLKSELDEWMVEGKKKETIDDETTFCDPSILKNVLDFKTVFDNLEPEELRKARTRSNPFELIRGGMFLNRAAMKMANMDHAFDFMFTNPKDEYGKSLIEPGELLYFADVCAGPGGFSEYVLWRRKWRCKGFGFTLKAMNDFKLDDFFAGSPETFEPHYGDVPKDSAEGDGDIYRPINLEKFSEFVMNTTDHKGVHFVMADGGFSVEGKENLQEILSKRLYLCQFLCAMMILRTGGHFVCKLFDLFTTFSVGLVYLMYRAFDQITIFKPNTSRPANSERYIVCKWKKANTKDICDYMFDVNSCLEVMPSTSMQDITEVVPLHVIQSDEKFFNYICDSNNVIGERQILHLAKIRAFAQNTELHDSRQNDFRKECLDLWKIPDQARAAPSREDPARRFSDLAKDAKKYLESSPEPLKAKSLSHLQNIFDFKAVICGEVRTDFRPTFFISMGRCNIYYLDMNRDKWIKIEVKLELTADTIFYGELIYELRGEGRAQKKVLALHVIDVMFLGGTDVRELRFEQRITQAQMLVKAVSKPSKSDYTPLRVKQVWALEDVKHILNRLVQKQVKGGGNYERLCFKLDDDDSKDSPHFIPSGMMIFKTTSDNWIIAFSNTHQMQYYFDTKQNKSVFEQKPASAAHFRSCFEKRIFWNWDKNVNLLSAQSHEDDESLVHGDTFWTFVRSQYKNITKLQPHF